MSRPRLAFHSFPAAVYAIGDVHGCLEQLLALEAEIAADGSRFEGEKWLVTLGDHIDRGPDSAGVIAHVMGPAPAGFRRFSLVGNHEMALLEFLGDPVAYGGYIDEGGRETLDSYGIDIPLAGSNDPAARLRTAVEGFPRAAAEFMASMPISLSLPGWLFVHAGIRPGIPLALQSDEDMVWIRAPFLTSQLTGGLRVVHGHTPNRDVVVTPHRIDVDTMCFRTGKLSAVRVMPDGSTKVLSVER